jgi:hypothetical protein
MSALWRSSSAGRMLLPFAWSSSRDTGGYRASRRACARARLGTGWGTSVATTSLASTNAVESAGATGRRRRNARRWSRHAAGETAWKPAWASVWVATRSPSAGTGAEALWESGSGGEEGGKSDERRGLHVDILCDKRTRRLKVWEEKSEFLRSRKIEGG